MATMQVIGFVFCMVGVGLLSWGLFDLFKVLEAIHKYK